VTSNDGFIGFLPRYCENGACGATKPANYEEQGWRERAGLLFCEACTVAFDIAIETVCETLELEARDWVKQSSFNYRAALADLAHRIGKEAA
jgi:hypothetical protein